ncbi:MAG: ZIP family metal transporter [Chlamydiae bacterium]|nr:ZIP family metal transporter [Chlamydiota bacterium]MBI3267092.1 ZIP family metal transporter [Chlamydiota bacterium]
MTIIFISIAAFLTTLLGGLFALKFKDKLHLFIGFSAGAVIGVAFFDLLPEAIELGSKVYPISFLTSMTALGFVIYMILDRTALLHSHPDEACKNPTHSKTRGRLSASSLSLHSFLDGIAIGLAFQVSASVGVIVATAVLVHDFSDGINTVSVILKNGGEKKLAFRWLLADSLAPALGVLSTLFFTLSEQALGLVLALFTGFFLYIGASDLLPESHHAHPTQWTTFTTLLGILVLYLVIRLASF